ncbi:MAG: glycosyltransferase family 4 protein [Nitrospinae bacterium]|nr:glycosyltransferase family 4 protein [Nitrospinota bacterium]
MKCRLITSWPSDSGVGSGVVVVARSLGKILSDKGFEVEFISGDFSSGGYMATSLRRIRFNYKMGRLAELRDGLPTAAFDFDGFDFSKGTRFVSVNQGILADVARFESGAVRQAVRLMAALERRAISKAERVFAPSRFSAGKITELYGAPPAKITVAPNGVFRGQVSPPTRAGAGGASVLCVARLYKRKGVDLLLRAWPGVVAAIPEAELKIAGGGLEYEQLRRMARELGISPSVTFLGDVTSREAVAELFARCDLFCLPSRHETFGLVFLEAMAAGRPVVALDSTAVPEVVRNGVDGILVEPGGKGLPEAVISLLKDPALRENMGTAGRERVLKEFLWEKTSGPLVDYFKRW